MTETLAKPQGKSPWWRKWVAYYLEPLLAPFHWRREQLALRAEIDLLTSYSTDTIYRLRYDTMAYDYISPSVTRLLGYTPEELKEINFRSLIRETKIVADGLRTIDSFEQLEQKRERRDINKWHADYRIQRKDGSEIWISDVSYPWFDSRGAIIGSVGSLREITDRVNAENKIHGELVRLANADALTGLANRRVFFERLEDELKRIRRSGSEVAILIVDVDHFKRVNDSQGHGAGDAVLVELAQVMTTCLRTTDIAARLGGEEFGILLPDTGLEGAFWVAERLREAVAKRAFLKDRAEYKPVHCTVSVGVAGAEGGEESTSAHLYKTADTRLYIAKNTGRNQVSVDELFAAAH